LLLTPGKRSAERLYVSPGIVGIMPDGEFQSNSVRLSLGRRIVCYTDGVTEAMNGRQVLFGENGLAGACARWSGVPIEQMVERIFREVDQFVADEPHRDDQAMLALEVTK